MGPKALIGSVAGPLRPPYVDTTEVYVPITRFLTLTCERCFIPYPHSKIIILESLPHSKITMFATVSHRVTRPTVGAASMPAGGSRCAVQTG
eukprot:9709-Prorocentrum_minimum.AAC.7